MERIVNNTVMTGIVIENVKNENGTYDGVIKTTNGNIYHYFDIETNLAINSPCEFNMCTTTKDYCDFEAVNIKI